MIHADHTEETRRFGHQSDFLAYLLSCIRRQWAFLLTALRGGLGLPGGRRRHGGAFDTIGFAHASETKNAREVMFTNISQAVQNEKPRYKVRK
jgi:hypothetical protein